MFKHISSTQNQTIKQLQQLLEKSRVRKREGSFVLEGRRELQLAIQGDYTITTVYVAPHVFDPENLQELLKKQEGSVTIITLSEEVYNKLAYRGSTEGILAFAKAKSTQLDDLILPENPLILVAEAPEKPGNIGALLRTADAAAVDAVIIANPKTDVYNPNIIRSSVGCVFTNQVAIAPSDAVITYLSERNISCYTAILQESQPYHKQDYSTATAIVVGTEATGLSASWRTAAMTPISIPMNGVIDSMNVSVAAGILIFEARKQRGF